MRELNFLDILIDYQTLHRAIGMMEEQQTRMVGDLTMVVGGYVFRAKPLRLTCGKCGTVFTCPWNAAIVSAKCPTCKTEWGEVK